MHINKKINFIESVWLQSFMFTREADVLSFTQKMAGKERDKTVLFDCVISPSHADVEQSRNFSVTRTKI